MYSCEIALGPPRGGLTFISPANWRTFFSAGKAFFSSFLSGICRRKVSLLFFRPLILGFFGVCGWRLRRRRRREKEKKVFTALFDLQIGRLFLPRGSRPKKGYSCSKESCCTTLRSISARSFIGWPLSSSVLLSFFPCLKFLVTSRRRFLSKVVATIKFLIIREKKEWHRKSPELLLDPTGRVPPPEGSKT